MTNQAEIITRTHSTLNEIEFLNGLGTHSIHPLDRETLLQNYIEAAENRADWGKINKHEAVAHAKKLLNDCRAVEANSQARADDCVCTDGNGEKLMQCNECPR